MYIYIYIYICTQISHKESLSNVFLFIRLAAKHNRDSAKSCEWWAIKLNEQDYNAAHVTKAGFIQKVLSSMIK